LLQAVRGISELVTVHGLINLDFADVRSIMADMGMAMMGTARASGENRAAEAAQRAISSPLLEDTSIKGARGLLINVTGGPDMALYEVNEAASLIQEEAHEDANIIFGAVIDEEVADEIHVTVIATGFGEHRREAERRTSRYTPSGAPLAPVKEAPAQPVELQPPPEISIPEPPPPPPASQSDIFNGKPVRRLGLIDESSLDISAFKRRNGEQGGAASRIGQHGLERDDQLDNANVLRKPVA